VEIASNSLVVNILLLVHLVQYETIPKGPATFPTAAAAAIIAAIAEQIDFDPEG